jgi:hypothetical protein
VFDCGNYNRDFGTVRETFLRTVVLLVLIRCFCDFLSVDDSYRPFEAHSVALNMLLTEPL